MTVQSNQGKSLELDFDIERLAIWDQLVGLKPMPEPSVGVTERLQVVAYQGRITFAEQHIEDASFDRPCGRCYERTGGFEVDHVVQTVR